MPTPSTSDLPKPKSWDEFEDIIWEIYTRRWKNIHTQRYGRSGQEQSGVDIYGEPHASKGYTAIQCKRYQDNKLNQQVILAEIEKADNFPSPISEYIIATTASRDVKIQDIVRDVNTKRRLANKFLVHIIFWEDVCNWLAESNNYDILEKHYSEWGKIFQKRYKTKNSTRKRWRNLASIDFPILSDSEKWQGVFINYLAEALKDVYKNEGYTEFISLISKQTTTTNIPLVFQLVSHKAKFCNVVHHLYIKCIEEIIEIKTAGFSKKEETVFKEDMKLQSLRNSPLSGWKIHANIVLSANPTAHKFIFDPDTQSISISCTTKSIWKDDLSTSQLMIILSKLFKSSSNQLVLDLENLVEFPKLMQIYINVMDNKSINYDDFRVNVDDDEDWDYTVRNEK